MPLVGAPKLQHLCVTLLIDFRDCLDDIGDTPIELLQPIFLRCNAEQLTCIEDGSREGGREVHDYLQPHWHRVFVADFGGRSHNSLQGLQHTEGSRDVAGLQRNWRQLYEAGQESLKQKAAGLGKRLRAMTQAEVQSRQTRHVAIIEAPRSLKRHNCSSSTRTPKQQLQIIPARQRVLSKLGLLHSSSLKQLVQIRPPGKVLPTAATRQQQGTSKSPAKTLGSGWTKQPPSQQPAGLKRYTSKGNVFMSQSVRVDKTQTAKQSVLAPVATQLASSLPTGNLVEDDIDWMSSDVPQAAHKPVPANLEPWTIRYLEEQGNDAAELPAARRSKLDSRHTMPKVSDTKQGSPSLDKAPVKHGTAAWVEDDIQWD